MAASMLGDDDDGAAEVASDASIVAIGAGRELSRHEEHDAEATAKAMANCRTRPFVSEFAIGRYTSGVVRAGAFAVVAVAIGLSRDPGCGGPDDPQGGKNAPCTRNSDCKSGLTCSEGVCVDTSTPATPVDGGAIEDASNGGG